MSKQIQSDPNHKIALQAARLTSELGSIIAMSVDASLAMDELRDERDRLNRENEQRREALRILNAAVRYAVGRLGEMANTATPSDAQVAVALQTFLSDEHKKSQDALLGTGGGE